MLLLSHNVVSDRADDFQRIILVTLGLVHLLRPVSLQLNLNLAAHFSTYE